MTKPMTSTLIAKYHPMAHYSESAKVELDLMLKSMDYVIRIGIRIWL